MTASSATRLGLLENRDRTAGLFSSPTKQVFICSLLLILATAGSYCHAGKNAFINFDDIQYITGNSHVASGLNWNTVGWAFTTFEAGNWHPLTWVLHAFNYQLFGLNASGHHFVSVFLHALNSVLIFLILQSISGFTGRSLATAALFALHPLNVESVAWGAELKTVLSVFFFLLALWAYAWYVRRPGLMSYFRVAALYALALMAKPQVIIFPFALLLLDYWPLRRMRLVSAKATNNSTEDLSHQRLSRLVIEKVPLFLLSALSAMVTLRAQQAGHAVRTAVEYPITSRIENAIISYAEYLRDVFFPYHLAPIYPHQASFPKLNIVLAAAVLIVVTLAALLWRKAAPYLAFGWFWFLGTLVPMIGIVQVGEQARADRYMYVPLIGIAAALVWGGADLLDSFKIAPAWRAAMVAVVIGILSIATYRQVGLWRDSETLWHYTLSVTNNNFMAEDNLAQELAHQGRTEEALVHFHRALDLHNYEPSQLITFGAYEQRNGHSADAIKSYYRAYDNSSDPAIRTVALSNIGSAYMDMKDWEHAKASFDAALRVDSKNVPALVGSGLIAQRNGNLQSAIAEYTKAASIKPYDLAYELLGLALEQSGRIVEANQAYEQVRRLSSDPAQTRSTAEHLLKGQP